MNGSAADPEGAPGGASAEVRAALAAVFDPALRADPYGPLAVLREAAPVLYDEESGTRFLTGFADCQAVLAGPDFVVPDGPWLAREHPEWAARPAADFFYASLLGTNGAAHERLRGPLTAVFGPRRAAELSAGVEKVVDELLDRFEDATSDGGAADFQALVGYPLPVAVVGELIGVPRAEQERFHRLGRDAARLLEPVRSDEDWRRADTAVTALREYFTGLLRERRARPAEDLASALLARARPSAARAQQPADRRRPSAARERSSTENEPPLGERELADLLLLVFVAGFETTAGLLGTAVSALLAHPEQAALLRADPGLLPGAVEEALRWDGPVLMTERLAARPTEVGGVAVPAGGSVTAVLGAANRDPRRYPDPDAFLVTRPDVRVLSFGAGPHYCFGAALARLETAVLLGRLSARFPRLAPAGPPVRRASACLRSFDALPLAATG
ncbi:cytochrome P450 [Kitasatospora sp. SolWspMP-SS2h]|uniref:cytochrome P450 n=1 Tax=Kitasatospora sp. SolWspMP-SS2h TaxID=1305729 RepID=UPI000DBA30A0|nr:cytochrome P450 [Kitasatospora sp. SolWspMP-SS2h]RAJ38492.1 cytochrome P450 [Kitasatospora sp. SolWspMP-SS2h]